MNMQEMYVLVPASDKICWFTGIQVLTNRKNSINLVRSHMETYNCFDYSIKTNKMKYYSAIKKNTFESVLMRWMKLEPIIQSEVSQ